MKALMLILAVVLVVGYGTIKPTPPKAFVNTVGMKFVPMTGTNVAFCIWKT